MTEDFVFSGLHGERASECLEVRNRLIRITYEEAKKRQKEIRSQMAAECIGTTTYRLRK